MENRNTLYKMTKTVEYIDAPHDWIGTDDYSSHRPLLWLAINNVKDGAVVEFGCGEGSTKLLSLTAERFFSFETNEKWAENYPKTKLTIDYAKVKVSPLGILFIDSAPGEQRKDLIELHKDNADVIIVHDTEEGAEYVYHMAEILSTFKYRLNYEPIGKPHTTVVSNFIDVTTWI